jgi:hypothetical protein
MRALQSVVWQSRHWSVTVVTRLWTEQAGNQGSLTSRMKERDSSLSSTASRLTTGPIQVPIQWVLALCPGVKQPALEADHLSPSRVDARLRILRVRPQLH